MDLFAAADEALKAGDLAGYQQKQKEAQAKTEEAFKLLEQ